MFFSDKDHKELQKIISDLILECSEIKIISPFITKNAFNLFFEQFRYFLNKGGKIKIITTNFNTMSSSFNILDLKEIKNIDNDKIEIWIQLIESNEQKSLHMKAFIFKTKTKNIAIIGSSNLTFKGLNYGEFNVKLDDKKTVEKIDSRFDEMLTDENFNWKKIENLKIEDFLNKNYKKEIINSKKVNITEPIKLKDFQEEIIEVFKKNINKQNHLIVLPTGTGKTIVSLFLFKEFFSKYKKGRLLFVAHRKEIVENAWKLFSSENFICEMIEKNNSKFKSDSNIFITTKLLWNMIKKGTFNRDDFQFIIYDEAHHINSESEKNQFKKIFCFFNSINNIALSATPERTDGFNISEIFGTPLYDMRLQKALEKEIVSNFNYFLMRNEKSTSILKNDLKNDKILYKKLNSHFRQELLLKMIRTLISNVDNKTVVFCISKEHASETNELLLKNGYKSSCLIDGVANRNEIISNFINGITEFICVVDIFNEGIDIPKINNIIFLRPTKSKIVFLQQLGRGLRKLENKILNVFDIVDNIDNKNYWYDKLSCFLTESDILKFFKNEEMETNVGFSFDKLSHEEILEKLKKNFDKINKKQIYWVSKAYTENDMKNFNLLFVIDEQTKRINQIFDMETKNNLNHEFLTGSKVYFSDSDNFKGLSLNILVKKLGELKNYENDLDWESIRVRKKEFIYNFVLDLYKDKLILKPGTKLFKEFTAENGEKFKANAVILENGILLLKNSYVKPFGRKYQKSESKEMWNDSSNFQDEINEETNLRITSRDIYFKNWKFLADFVVGGNDSAQRIFVIEDINKKIKDFYIDRMLDFFSNGEKI